MTGQKKQAELNFGRPRPKTAKQEETWKLYRRVQWTGKNCPTGRPQHPTRIQRYVTLSETKSQWRRRAPSTYLSISTLKYPSLSFRQFPSISRICRAQKGHIEWWNHLRSTVSWVPCWSQVAQQNREDKFKSPKETHKNPIYGSFTAQNAAQKMAPKWYLSHIPIYHPSRHPISTLTWLPVVGFKSCDSIFWGPWTQLCWCTAGYPLMAYHPFPIPKLLFVGSPCLRNTPLAES